MVKLSNEEVINKCKSVHGDKYDYSKVNYIDNKTKICIVCPEHGEFWQHYYNHIKGCGCPSCGGNKRVTTKEYVSTLIKRYGNDNISFEKVNYVNNHTPITLVCKEHGDWSIYPSSLKDKCECPECQKARLHDTLSMDTDDFIEKAKEIHHGKYNYSKVEYVNCNTKVCIVCPEHGEFWQTPSTHYKSGCPKCATMEGWDKRGRMTSEKMIQKFTEVHKDKYDYSKVQYVSPKEKVCIICPEHGEFWQLPYAHLNGNGCPKCGLIERSKKFSMSTEEFINRSNIVHKNSFDYSKTKYVKSDVKVEIICKKHGAFFQNPMSHLKGVGCPMCYAEMSVSREEMELRDFVKELCSNAVRFNVRNIIQPLELDIVDDANNIAIEYDGLYWHSDEKLKDCKYHLNKTNLCSQNGYRLIHIFEDEWLDKKEIVKSRLENIFGKTPYKIGARKCMVREISQREAKEFLTNNHIQGNVNSSIRYGLFYNGELVSVMTFGKLRKNLGSTSEEGHYELVRFCNKLHCNVIGGASKLLHHFIREFNPKRIISYADKRWSNGEMYVKLGFEHLRDSKPSYFYSLHGKTRENRFKYRKDILVSEGYDKNKSESQIMRERGYSRIYDCGCMVFERTFNVI